MLTDGDLNQLRPLGYKGTEQITYDEVRTGDLVQTCGKYRDVWSLGEILRVHSFSNMAHDFTGRTLAWLSDGMGKGCPLVVLERNPDGLAPDHSRHMPSPGYGYEHGVAQRAYQYRCADQSCRCYQGVDPDWPRKQMEAADRDRKPYAKPIGQRLWF